jgi:hypothetical protein
MGRLLGFVGAIALAFCAGAQSLDRTLAMSPRQVVAGEARHALVIGNSAYRNSPLRNPVNDARATANALAQAGFSITLLEDATQAAMLRAIRSLGDRLAKGGVGLFYYAGHGVQVKGRNYLIPVNADIAREYEIEFGAVDMNLVLAMMDSAKNALNIVILDACRNNPFARSFRSVQNGLAQMDAPTGSFIAFATAPGSVASDGDGENGVYTKHLLAEIAKPGVPIELMFKQVRNGVMRETKGAQTPWESSSLRGEFAFRPGAPQPSVADAVAEALRKERESQRQETERLVRAALEQQRKQLEALGLRPTAPSKPAPAAAAVPAPALTSASLAPSSTLAPQTARGLPQAGDSWTYRLVEPKGSYAGAQRNYVSTISAVSPDAILERYAIDDGPSGEWAHGPGGYLAGLGKSLFAPYFPLLGEAPASGSVGRVRIEDPACNPAVYVCDASARIVGREIVRVPAGSFESIRVEVEHTWQAAQQSGSVTFTAHFNGSRKLTVWYAPAVKRAVKFSSRRVFGEIPPVDTHFDLELVSYELK